MVFPLCSLGWDSNRGRDVAKDALLRRAFRRRGPGSMAWEGALDWMAKAEGWGCAAEGELPGERAVRGVAEGAETPPRCRTKERQQQRGGSAPAMEKGAPPVMRGSARMWKAGGQP